MRRWLWAAAVFSSQMVQVPMGSYPSFYRPKTKASSRLEQKIQVEAFSIDRTPVTRAEFLSFVKRHPEWRRSRAKSLFVDSHYLKDWRSDLNPGSQGRTSPITWVSWFAAKAYCESKHEALPSTDQWEYVAFDQGRGKKQITKEALDWYATPQSSKPLRAVGRKKPNGFGVSDLVGLIWEWTSDFNSAIVDDGESNAFCGNASVGVVDPSDYVGFMRRSFRSSLKAKYTAGSLGFRCVKGKP